MAASTWNVTNETDVLKAAQTFHLPRQLKYKKTHHAKKSLPFESIDLSLYTNEKGENPHNLVAFRVDRHRLCPWAYALLKYHVLTKNSDKAEVSLTTEQGNPTYPDSEDFFQLQVELSNVTITLFFVNGVITIQGEQYEKWSTTAFNDILDIVNSKTTTIKQMRLQLSKTAGSEPNKDGEETVNSVHPINSSSKETDLTSSPTRPSSPAAGKDNASLDSSMMRNPDISSPDPKDSTTASQERQLTPKPSPKEKFLSQAANVKDKSNNAFFQMESAMTKLIDVINKLESDASRFQNEMKSDISGIKQQLGVVISEQAEIKAMVESSDKCCKSNKTVLEKSDKAIQKLQSDLSACSNKVATAATTSETSSTTLGKLQGDMNACINKVNTVQTNILDLTQTTNALKTDIAAINLGPGARPKMPQATHQNAAQIGVTRSPADRQPPEIKSEVDTFIFTDSIARQLNPSMFKQHKCQTAAYGGLDNKELISILNQIPPCSHIKSAVIHSGYKDSKAGPTINSQREVRDIISSAKAAFPEATIFVADVLPRKKNLNRSNIDDYNRSIEKACTESNAIFISLISCVTANDGRKVSDKMFEDSIHLNSMGAKAMADLIGTFLPVNTSPPQTSSVNTDADKETPTSPKDNESIQSLDNDDFEDDTDEDINEDMEAYESYETPQIKTFPVFQTGANKFQAHVAKVHSQSDVRKVMCTINSKAFDATTNTVAYRFVEGKKRVQEVIDDGEKGAGSVMLDALNDFRVPNTIVIISRYYGGKLGDGRFKIYYDLTATGVGHDPRVERPTPNKYPRSDKSPPLSSTYTQKYSPLQWQQQSHTQIPAYAQNNYVPMSQQQFTMKQPYYMQQQQFPNSMSTARQYHYNNPGNQGQYTYRDAAYNNNVHNNGNRRYTYYDGKRVTVQYT